MAELEHRPYLLPARLQELGDLIGVPAAIAVARKWGGSRLYVPDPENLKSGHPLARHIGRQAALMLCTRYASEHIDIPSARPYLRWYDARTYKAAGKSTRSIARLLGITVQSAQKILQGFDAGNVIAEPDAPARCPVCGRGVHKIRPRESFNSQLDFGFPRDPMQGDAV